MKPSRYATNKQNPAVKGNLTAEEIVRTDWERNFKDKGVPFNRAKAAIKAHVDRGGDVARVRNTLVLVTPEDESYQDVKFHTITADPAEVYQTMMLMFLISLARVKGTQVAYTYINDKSAGRSAKRLFGSEFVDIEDSEEPRAGKYRLTLDIGRAATTLAQRVPRGVQ